MAVQVRGVARTREALRETVTAAPTDAEDEARVRARRRAAVVWIAVLAVLGFGSRHLLGGHFPTVGALG
ncbi:hypothetical protein ABTM60_20840, partial [Acinetobacter baumannii]